MFYRLLSSKKVNYYKISPTDFDYILKKFTGLWSNKCPTPNVLIKKLQIIHFGFKLFPFSRFWLITQESAFLANRFCLESSGMFWFPRTPTSRKHPGPIFLLFFDFDAIRVFERYGFLILSPPPFIRRWCLRNFRL